jgi:plastocyanin
LIRAAAGVAGGCLLLAILVAGCAGRGPVTRRVEIQNFVFDPDTVRASLGDTIVWTNHDLVPHTATAQGIGDTGPMAQNASGRWVVSRKGTQAYVCIFHPTMHGVIQVD